MRVQASKSLLDNRRMNSTPFFKAARSDRTFFSLNAVLSVGALLFLGWLLVWRQQEALSGWNLRMMPAVNAGLNSISAVLLLSAYVAIRRGKRKLHQALMMSAFGVSALFLVGYVAYHFVHGDTKYVGEGPLRTFYFFVLISHIVLSMAVVPLSLTSFYLAFQKRFEAHKKVTRWTFPIWLYVSVTGVLIYFLLRNSVPAVP